MDVPPLHLAPIVSTTDANAGPATVGSPLYGLGYYQRDITFRQLVTLMHQSSITAMNKTCVLPETDPCCQYLVND